MFCVRNWEFSGLLTRDQQLKPGQSRVCSLGLELTGTTRISEANPLLSTWQGGGKTGMDHARNDLEMNSRDWWEEYHAEGWQANGGSEQTAHFMERLVSELAPDVKQFLQERHQDVLDWGCALGEGVEALSRAFPRCRVAGLDFSRMAISIARRNHPAFQFLESSEGQIPRAFDVIVTSNCLEHFEDPLDIARRHLGACRQLYIILVPFREDPLSAHHRIRFEIDTFPPRLAEFIRIQSSVIEVDRRLWAGQQLLAVYAAPSFVAGWLPRATNEAEIKKWDHYYSSLSQVEESEALKAFDDDLAQRIAALLPEAGQVLEAGCGGGLQSLALARTGKHELTLMDFSTEALEHARRLFKREGACAAFVLGDVLEPGAPEFDLVFNAGVLEHYEFDEQVKFIQGMASRSRCYVLVLVPNRLCYWYWIWRVRASADGDWPYGKEAPMVDLSRAFKAAGLSYLGQYFGGETWSENFINALPGLDPSLRELILKVHRSEIIPVWQRGYLLGALGCIGEPPAKLPSCWSASWPEENPWENTRTSTLADTLALVVAGENRLAVARAEARAQQAEAQERLAQTQELLAISQAAWSSYSEELHLSIGQKEGGLSGYKAELQEQRAQHEATVATLNARVTTLEAELAAATGGRAWVMVNTLRKLRHRVAPPGSFPAPGTNRDPCGEEGHAGAAALRRGGGVEFVSPTSPLMAAADQRPDRTFRHHHRPLHT